MSEEQLLRAERDQLKGELDAAETHNRIMREQMNEWKGIAGERDQLRARVAELGEVIEKTHGVIVERDEAKARVAELEAQRDWLKAAIGGALARQWPQRLAELEAQLADANGQRDAIRELYEGWQQRAETAEAQLAEANEQLRILSDNAVNLEAQLAAQAEVVEAARAIEDCWPKDEDCLLDELRAAVRKLGGE